MSTKADYCALVIGPQGYGKSSLGAELAERRLRQGSWVIAQDMNRETGRFCVGYPSPAEFLQAVALAAKEDRPIPRGAAFAASADVVIGVAASLGEAWNRGSSGAPPHPICVLINEATSFEAAGSTFVGQELARVLNQRRHLGLELVLCMQNAAQLPASVFEAATEVHLFRQNRSDRIDMLEQRLGEPRGRLAGLAELVPHRYASWRPVVGMI